VQLEDFQDNIDTFSADFAESVLLISNGEVAKLNEAVSELQTQLKDVGLSLRDEPWIRPF